MGDYMEYIKVNEFNDFDVDLQDHNLTNMVPESLVRKHMLIPIDLIENRLMVAMENPFNIEAIDDLRLVTGYDIFPVKVDKDKILKFIEQYYIKKNTKVVLKELESNYLDTETDLVDLSHINSSPVVKIINSIIEEALEYNTSDIHMEPTSEDLRVRYRIDGDLIEIMSIPKVSQSNIITRIKIMGNMDIAEKRLPQDGKSEFFLKNKTIDIRISSIPTIYGEKIVLRLLDKTYFNFTKESLGFSKSDLIKINKIIKQPSGLLLVVGPTGSGKTTTIYTILQELNTINRNIITIEDPIEYKIDGINQMQINNKAGLTFASGLRSILRQDPDIIMVGEIRDEETAEISVRASITGHLVLSTVHTSNSSATISRILNMGIKPYLFSSSVIGIIAQRLVKKLCPICKEKHLITDDEKQILNMKEDIFIYKSKGCNQCNKGYKGRQAVYEIMEINEDIRDLIIKEYNIDKIKKQTIENGMITLSDSAKDLVINGQTSLEEILKIGLILG